MRKVISDIRKQFEDMASVSADFFTDTEFGFWRMRYAIRDFVNNPIVRLFIVWAVLLVIVVGM